MIRKLFFVFLLVLISAGLCAQSQAVIKEIAGKVEIRVGTGSWQPARSGVAVPTGAYISTGFNSTAVLGLAGSLPASSNSGITQN